MTVFRFDIGLRRVGDPVTSQTPGHLEILLSELPAPVRALLATESVDQTQPSSDAGREIVLRNIVAKAAAATGVAWDVRAIALSHLIDRQTGDWIYIPGSTLFELLEDDSPYQPQVRIAGRDVKVSYEIGVRSS